jgi:hypothetical protein
MEMHFLMGVIVFELSVYYHDVLRYTIIANLDKVQELRNEGYYVQVQAVPGQSYDGAGGDGPYRFQSIKDGDASRLSVSKGAESKYLSSPYSPFP